MASYDVACIYDKNINVRFDKYGWDISEHLIEWAIPKFHINAHREHCRANYNLHFIPFACRYDGESIERLWAEFNAAATSTKEMGPGSRRDTLDDIFGHHNWGKVIMLRKSSCSVLTARTKLTSPSSWLSLEQDQEGCPGTERPGLRISRLLRVLAGGCCSGMANLRRSLGSRPL